MGREHGGRYKESIAINIIHFNAVKWYNTNKYSYVYAQGYKCIRKRSV